MSPEDHQMTSGREKCGLSSLFPMSCRGRAEDFARRLHSRLRSLGSQDGNGAADENSWLTSHENPLTLSQPRHVADTELYLDFGTLESPGSPDELEGDDFEKLMNEDNLKLLHSEDCHCSVSKGKGLNLYNNVKAASYDSDSSDGPFYDSENDVNHQTQQLNGVSHSDSDLSEINGDDKTNEEISADEELYITSSECTLPNCSSSLSDDVSTLSLKDNDSSSEYNSSLPDTPTHHEAIPNSDNECKVTDDTEIYTSSLTIEKDLTIECPNHIEAVQQCSKLEFNDSVANDDDDVEPEERTPRVRRCSSLKTGKTPPGTPGRKKIVRFADVLGLDLADVRTFLDEIPKIPNSAYNDLRDVDLNESETDSRLNQTLKLSNVKIDKVLVPLFQQPGGQPNFIDRIREHQVCLDNVLVDDPVALTITGTVRVKNLDFHKTVHVRYTLDSWQSFADVQALYVENSCDGFSDKFSFTLCAHSLSVGQKLEFAIRFQCKGCQYWDSNNGANYCFQCLPATNTTSYTPITGSDDNWGASFYY